MHTTPSYRIRYCFEWGTGCLWSADAATKEQFGYDIAPEALPLSAYTIERVNELVAWHDRALNWAYPPDPGPWRQDECDRFHQAAKALLFTLREELGERFDVSDALVEMQEDPDLDAYLRDPRGFRRTPYTR